MVSTTELLRNRPHRFARLIAIVCLAALALAALTGCTQGATPKPAAGAAQGSQAASQTGHAMAGPDVKVFIAKSLIDAKPKAWDLSTPQSAVRSYLDWTTYAYRIATSDAASKTMTPEEEVRVDSYNQYNLENKKLLAQQLLSITFGTPSKTATATLLPAKEQWTYSYLSTASGNKVLGGPYSVGYDSVYTLVKGKDGKWLVASVKANKSSGTLK